MSEVELRTCHEAWEYMTAISNDADVRNFSQVLDMSDYVVVTDLFPIDVLDAYSAWNLGSERTEDQREHFNEERGGGQGD